MNTKKKQINYQRIKKKTKKMIISMKKKINYYLMK